MTWLYDIGIRLTIGAAMTAAVFAGGYISGKKAGQMEQLAATVAAYQKREKIDADVDRRDDYRICLDLGGVPDQCGKLRRVEPAPAGQ